MTATDLAERPIFVVGAPRSGTTLLRYMLCSHPRIYVPPESNFIPELQRHSGGSVLRRDQALRMLEEIGRYKTFWRDWREARLNPHAFLDGLDALTPAAIVDALYSRYARQHGAARWGDKTPNNVAHLSMLMKLFPTAQVIHAIRDGRDVTASSLDAYRGPRFFYTDPYYHARTWSDRVLCGRRAGRALPPDRYHEIRYEDLTADPQGRLRDLCRFLGESFHPSMASPSVEARRHHHSHGIHQLVRGPVTTARSGRWRADLLPQDQRLVQRVAAKALTDLGYPLFDLGHARPTEPVRQALFRGKYEVLSAGRQLLQASGISHPTWLIDFLPRRKKTPHPPPTSPARIASSEQS